VLELEVQRQALQAEARVEHLRDGGARQRRERPRRAVGALLDPVRDEAGDRADRLDRAGQAREDQRLAERER